MSRVDTTTIIIVVVLVIALGVLGYQLVKLYQDDTPDPTVTTQNDEETLPEEDVLEYPEDDPYYSDSTATDGTAATDSEMPAEEAAVSNDFQVDEETLPLTSSGDFLVLAGSFSMEDNAENQARQIRGLGYESAQVVMFNKGNYAVVLVDRFDSYGNAKTLAEEIVNQHGLEAFVLRKRGTGQ